MQTCCSVCGVKQEHINTTKSKDDSNELSQKGRVCSTPCYSLPAMNTFTIFIHVVFISAWLENELHQNPKIYIWSETFLSCSFAVSFDQWALCRGPLTSQRTSEVPGCSAGLVNGCALGQNIPTPANLTESLSKRKWFKLNRFFFSAT